MQKKLKKRELIGKVKKEKRLPVARIALWAVVFAFAAYLSLAYFPRSYRKLVAGLMPVETITPEDLTTAYAERRLKILLVPGHDTTDFGTSFNGVREADLTRELARELAAILVEDGHFRVSTTRNFTTGKFLPEFAAYFDTKRQDILKFRIALTEMMISAVRGNRFEKRTGVGHNTAPERVLRKLYGINKWANERDIEVTLHIHFNDHAGRRPGRVGNYEGFTIYVPERQFSSSRASRLLAEGMFNQLKQRFSVSTLPGESAGITGDQELIAVGAHGSLDGVGLLVEYGYIYEPQFISATLRAAVLRELAHQTYAGMKRYFEPQAALDETTLLPHQWQAPLATGADGSRDVLALQTALHTEGLYPPPGKNLADCSLTGTFDSCTEAAVRLFQEKYAAEILGPAGLTSASGSVGPATIRKLNELYGSGHTASGG